MITSARTSAPAEARLVISGCGPGELTAWIAPLAQALSASPIRWRLTIALLPRLFLSGQEAAIARGLPGVEQVLTPHQTLRWTAGLAGRARPAQGSCNLLLHLGGPAALSLALARRLQAPAIAYSEQPDALPAGFATVYCTDPQPETQTAIPVGNLLVDAVAAIRERRTQSAMQAAPGDPAVVGLLPGSRLIQLRQGLPQIGALLEHSRHRSPGARFLIARSPLVTDAMLQRALSAAATGLRHEADGSLALVTPQGIAVPFRPTAEVFALASCLVTSPGTNTGEAAALGIPHIVVAPFDGGLTLLGGWAGLLEGGWPVAPVKRLLVRRLTRGLAYFAQANVRAGREMVPELRGPLDMTRVAEQLAALLDDAPGRARMSQELLGVMGPPGAARRLRAELERQLAAGGGV